MEEKIQELESRVKILEEVIFAMGSILCDVDKFRVNKVLEKIKRFN